MHWLIAAVSHSLSSLLAWHLQSLTVIGIVLSFLSAGAQSIHPWSIFYGLFALTFAAGTFATQVLGHERRGARQLLCAFLASTTLISLHQYYLQARLAEVPWFHIFRSPSGCLPIPSRTFTKPFRYGFVDALGNALPYGIVVSYCIAMGQMFSEKAGSRVQQLFAAAGGAFLIATAAAYGLPMCGTDDRDGSHQVAMHMDRSVDWNERVPMTWSTTARYGWFVASTTAIGMSAAISSRRGVLNTAHEHPRRPANEGEKASLLSEKIMPARTSDRGAGGAQGSEQQAERAIGNELTDLVINMLATACSIIAMAVWSWSGPRAEQEATLPGPPT